MRAVNGTTKRVAGTALPSWIRSNGHNEANDPLAPIHATPPNPWLHAEGEFEQDGKPKTIAVSIRPQYGTVGADWVKSTAPAAVKGRGFDLARP